MKRKNMATMVACIALVGAVAVGGTLALLSQGSKVLTNTFTAGANYEAGDFVLKEHGVNQVFTEEEGYVYGSYKQDTNPANIKDGTEGKEGNTYGEIVPGTVLDKDPWFELVHGDKETPDSWIVARLGKAQLYALQQKGITIEKVAGVDTKGAQWKIVTQDEDGNWKVSEAGITKDVFKVNEEPAPGEEQYIYFIFDRKLVDNGNSDQTTALFTQLAAGANAAEVNDLTLNVQGVAVQALSAEEAVLNNQGTINAIMEQALGTWPTPLVG